MNSQYSIRLVERADLDAFWQLRLKALLDHPNAFGSDYASSKESGPSYTERGYFDGGINSLFAAFSPGGELIGQAGTFAEVGKRSHIAHIISVYVHPDHRGHEIGSDLVQQCIDHLSSFSAITSIRISVNAANVSALRIYERLGFKAWGEEPDAIRTADGSCHNELHMVLVNEST